MDNDLISRSALFEEIEGIYKRHYEKSCYQFIHDFFKTIFRGINKAPAVDAETLRPTGRWIMTIYTTTSKRGRVISNQKFSCSECGYGNGRKKSNYCPSCGAKMEG